MSKPTNEFSDLDRTVVSPDGTPFELVAHVGFQEGGWALLWSKGKRTHVPIVTVYAKGHEVHQEPAADRQDGERIIGRLAGQISTGTFESP